MIERGALVLAQHDLSAAYGPITAGAGRGWARRISEGALCGATMAITLFVCVPLLGLSSQVEQQTSAWFVWLFSFALGFVFGLTAPHLYHRYRDGRPQLQMAVAYA